MASAVAPPHTPSTTTSVDPLYTAAVAQAKAALAAATQPIHAEQTASDAEFGQRSKDATDVAAALSKLLQPIGPAINGMYQTAAQNQELAAGGFSQGMKDALSGTTDNLNAMLQKLGQPTQLDSHATQAGDVLYGLGGYLPGTTFSKEGAAFGSAAELQAGDVILKGQENVKSLQAQKIVADQGFQEKIAELAGKLPGDVQTNYMHLQQLALSDAKFREQVRKDNIDAAYKSSELKLAQMKYSTGIDEFNAKQHLAYAKLANQEFNQNRDYAIKLTNLGIAQTKLQMAIVKNSFLAANGGLSKQAVAKYTSQAQAIAMDAYNGHTVYTTKNGVKSASLTPQLSYAEALSKILVKGTPVQIALDALDRVYPANQRPTPEILAKELGALDPAALQQVAQHQKQAAYNSQTQSMAGTAMTNPTALLKSGGLKFARVDQGVDFVASRPVPAFAPGHVVSITGGMAGGTGHIIKVRLDHPITVNGHTYYGIYYSEQTPLVHVGQRVGQGTLVMAAGGNEIGFLDQNMQMPPLIGGLGAGTQPSIGGRDFYTWLGGK